jgi:hypothetical protein
VFSAGSDEFVVIMEFFLNGTMGDAATKWLRAKPPARFGSDKVRFRDCFRDG